ERETREICLNLKPRNLTCPGLRPPRRAPSPSPRTGLSLRRLLMSVMASNSNSNSHSLICPRCLDARPTTTNTTALAPPPFPQNKLLRRRVDQTIVASRSIIRDARASPGRIRNV
ncbi:hypothetical protein C7212DRAFT_213287, partial [Tuber magnatum]